jgi:hypothetical protein
MLARRAFRELQKSGKGVSEADQRAGSLLLVRGKQAAFQMPACRISTIPSIARKQDSGNISF